MSKAAKTRERIRQELAAAGPLSITQVSRRLNIHPTTVGNHCRKLVELGTATASPDDVKVMGNLKVKRMMYAAT